MDNIEPSHLGGENTSHNGGNIIENKNDWFSHWFGYVNWFFGLRWYVILLITMFALFIIFQLESALEIRREKKKEGMQNNVEKIKGILRKLDEDKESENKSKKNVSFTETFSTRDNVHDTVNIWSQFYKWWILPWIYVIFRKFRGNESL